MQQSSSAPALASLQSRSRSFLGYLLWLFCAMALLWTANACAQLVHYWIAFLRSVRRAVGVAPPVGQPDYLIIGGLFFAVASVMVLIAAGFLAYRATWTRRLERAWGGIPPHFENKNRMKYLDQLSASPEWKEAGIVKLGSSREHYCELSEAILQEIETDVAARAIATGFVVGLNRNALLDTFTIVAAAFELQTHFLTRLGQRPSFRTWVDLLKCTGASIFLNTYVGREESLYLNLAIRKAALGLEMSADFVQETSGALADVDWDEILGGVSIPGLSAVTSAATMTMSVGAFGLRHIGIFIETAANDLLQGVLAGGVLYFHGMAIAADCLAIDKNHRQSVSMNRTISQSMSAACIPAGRILRDQVRTMRTFLRQRRQLAFTAAKDATKQGVEKVKDASMTGWASVKDAGKFVR